MRRLISTTQDSFERSLLRSARSEGPLPEQVVKAARALTAASIASAVGSSAAASTSASATATTSVAGVGSAATVGAATKAGLLLGAPWFVVGAIVGGAAIGTIEMSGGADSMAFRSTVASVERAPEPAASTLPEAPEAPSANDPKPEVASVRDSIGEFLQPAAPVASASPNSPTLPLSAPSASGPLDYRHSISQEIQKIDHVRQAFASGRSLEALTLLDQYNREFPKGQLSIEAEVLRIEACAASGQHSCVSSLAQQFLASHPRDPHTPRVRAILQSVSFAGSPAPSWSITPLDRR